MVSEIYVDIADVAGRGIAMIEVVEVTKMGDNHFTWSAVARVDRGSSVGEHRYTFQTKSTQPPNPLGILRAALNALDDEHVVLDGETVDRPNETPGPRSLER